MSAKDTVRTTGRTSPHTYGPCVPHRDPSVIMVPMATTDHGQR
jgi:hypothetical protein